MGGRSRSPSSVTDTRWFPMIRTSSASCSCPGASGDWQAAAPFGKKRMGWGVKGQGIPKSNSPWLYDVRTGHWDLRKVDGPTPPKRAGQCFGLCAQHEEAVLLARQSAEAGVVLRSEGEHLVAGEGERPAAAVRHRRQCLPRHQARAHLHRRRLLSRVQGAARLLVLRPQDQYLDGPSAQGQAVHGMQPLRAESCDHELRFRQRRGHFDLSPVANGPDPMATFNRAGTAVVFTSTTRRRIPGPRSPWRCPRKLPPVPVAFTTPT